LLTSEGMTDAILRAMKYPSGFEPETSSVYGRNEIIVAAPPERVWRWIIRAANWPKWYAHSADVEFLSGSPPDLAGGTEFRWKTFGTTPTCRVFIFDPPHEIGWEARSILGAYHGWTVEPDGRGGCRVITDECQNGIIPKLISWYLRPLVINAHQYWLERLKAMAEAGEPG